jgi:methyl-accepting chemotaxis protein
VLKSHYREIALSDWYQTQEGLDYFLGEFRRFEKTLTELSRGVFMPFEAAAPQSSAHRVPSASGAAARKAISELADIHQDTIRSYNDATGLPCLRMCFVGADSWQEGLSCGHLMANACPEGGEIAIIIASFSHIGHDLRRRAFQQALAGLSKRFTVVAVKETENKSELLQSTLAELSAEYPHLRGIYLTAGSQLGPCAQWIERKGLAGRIRLVGHDLLEATVQGIESGAITASLGQDPFAQGYNPLIYLYNHLIAQWEPPSFNMTTAQDVFTRETYKNFWDAASKSLRHDRQANRLAVPLEGHPNKQLRLVFLGREDSSFWKDPRAGVEAASALLAQKSCSVEWRVPAANREHGDSSAAAYGTAIRELISEGVDGIAVIAQDRGYIPYINEAVQAGIAVVTANSEPSGLSSYMYTIRQQLSKIKNYSDDLLRRMATAGMDVNGVSSTMEQLDEASGRLQSVVLDGRKSIQEMGSKLGSVVMEVEESAEASALTRTAVQDGISSIQQTLGGLSSLRGVVDNSWKGLQELVSGSSKIDAIMDTISDIAERIGVLAINATIEAVRAGHHGHGFSIIAREVRNLATQTGEASQKAVQLVQEIHSDIHGMESILTQGRETIDSSSVRIDQTVAILDDIRSRAEADAERARRISQSIEHVTNVSLGIHKDISSIDEVSQTIDSSVKAVRAAMDALTSSFQEVSKSAESLARLASSEQKALARFKFGDLQT